MVKILLVEDNEMNRDMLSRRLERRGYEVIIATDGLAGVEAAVTAMPDLVLDGHEPAGDRRLGSDTADQGKSRHRRHSGYRPYCPCHGR